MSLLSHLPDGCAVHWITPAGWHIWPTWRDGALHWARHEWTPTEADRASFAGVEANDLWRAWHE